jgi:putative CRISPR-associated protein (TIGR02619 family)
MQRLLLVSTCGTSVLTNAAPPALRPWLTEVANEAYVEDPRLDDLVQTCRHSLGHADESGRCRMSAEINGVHAILRRWRPEQVRHVLIHTDTWLGRRAAGLVSDCLEGIPLPMTAGGLRTSDLESFRAALAELTVDLIGLVEAYRNQGWIVIFHLTGGFKSLNGYLQSLGMLQADRCVFLFEGAPELMEIPRLPIRLAEAEELQDHLTVFRRLAVGYPVTEAEARGVPESFLLAVDGAVTRNLLGDVAWARHRHTLLSDTLQPPLSPRMTVHESIHRAFARLPPDLRVQVQDALDEFAAHLDLNRPLMKSRTFKALRGRPVTGSTHELYAWSSGSAGRLFGHWTDDHQHFVFDRLDTHL